MLFLSNRITLDSKKDDIYLSSRQNINIGAARNVLISTNEDLVIDSKSIYLGKYNTGVAPIAMEPIVLGYELITILEELTTILKDSAVMVQGVPTETGLMTQGAAPGTFKGNITSLEGKLNDILSEYHYIEPNAGMKL